MRLERDEDLYVNIGIEASEIVKQLERKAATCDCNIQRMLNQLAADALALADGWDRGKLTLGEVCMHWPRNSGTDTRGCRYE